MRWSPEGEMRIFQAAEDVPEGWADYHPNSRPVIYEPESPPELQNIPNGKLTLSRQQIIADLQRRGVVFQRNATTKALYDLLVSEVERSEA